MKCKICKTEVANLGELTKHRIERHPDVEQQRLDSLHEKAHPPKSEERGPEVRTVTAIPGTAKPAESIQTASFVRIVPRPFTMSPVYLWRAKETCINEWGWPADMADEDFVDTFFYVMCYKCGKDLDKAGNVTKEGGGNGSKQEGNGDNT